MKGWTSGVIRQVARVLRDGTLAGLSDREILCRFVDDRDESAFEALLARHGPMVLNVCRQVLRDPDDAEDAFQATFLALACKAGTLRVEESLGPWLYRVANRVAARCRAGRRRRGDRERPGGPIPEPAADRDGRAVDAEIARVVHEEVGRLPDRLRAPIVLCYLEGMTHDRAARQLGCPVGTVRSRLARARALLHGRIARRGLATTGATLGVVLATDARASVVSPAISRSLVETAARIAAGTASLRGGCGVPERVAALLEGILNMFRVKQIVGSMAVVSSIGALALIAGLSASGQTGDDPVRSAGRSATAKPAAKPPTETIVKTYYVGDLLIPPMMVLRPGANVTKEDQRREASEAAARRRWVDMTPLIDLITSTVARGSWTVDYGQTGIISNMSRDGQLGTISAAVPSFGTIGHITPFYLSISLIVRHTKEGHEEVADLLRHLRRLEESRAQAGGVDGHDRNREAQRIKDPVEERKPAAPAPTPDHNARIRHLLDELRKEVDALPK